MGRGGGVGSDTEEDGPGRPANVLPFVLSFVTFPLSFHPPLWLGGYWEKENRKPYEDRSSVWDRKGIFVKAPPPLPWPFGPHVAGYKIRDNTGTNNVAKTNKAVNIPTRNV